MSYQCGANVVRIGSPGAKVQSLISDIEAIDEIEVFGRVRTVQGLLIEVVGPVRELRVGGRVTIETQTGSTLACEIIGFRDRAALCLPFGPVEGIRPGCQATLARHDGTVYPDENWLGRVIDAEARPIDGGAPLVRGARPYGLRNPPLPAHARARVGGPIDLGIRCLNTFTTCCDGQRMGIFAGSGVGK